MPCQISARPGHLGEESTVPELVSESDQDVPELVNSSANEYTSSDDEGDSNHESLPELLPDREFDFGNPDDWYYLGPPLDNLCEEESTVLEPVSDSDHESLPELLPGRELFGNRYYLGPQVQWGTEESTVLELVSDSDHESLPELPPGREFELL